MAAVVTNEILRKPLLWLLLAVLFVVNLIIETTTNFDFFPNSAAFAPYIDDVYSYSRIVEKDRALWAQLSQNQSMLCHHTNRTFTPADNLMHLWLNMLDINWTDPSMEPRPTFLGNFLVPPSAATRSKDDVVLVTHGSVAKLENLCTQMQNWNGPASVAIYLSSLADVVGFQDFYAKERHRAFVNVTFHLVMEHKTPMNMGYPHNWLRNLALDQCGSDYFVALDVDFIPSRNSYEGLKRLLMTNEDFRDKLQNMYMFVMPAFEVFAKEGELTATPDHLPSSKEALHQLVSQGKAEEFHVQRYFKGHGPTNFSKWYDQGKTSDYYFVEYKQGFEPYVMGYRPGIPRYWNEYRGYGSNKVTWFKELNQAGYQFGVLSNYYVVHLEHPSTLNRMQKNMNLIEEENFKQYLRKRYHKFDRAQNKKSGRNWNPFKLFGLFN